MSLTWTTPAWMWPLLLVLAAGAVIWTVHVYGRTRPSPRPELGRVLISLRSTALILLVIAVAQPVLSRLFRQDDPGRLVFVLEDSGSMTITDMGAGIEGSDQLLSRWQAALGFSALIDSALTTNNWPGEAVFLRGNGVLPLQEFHLDDPVIPDPGGHGTNLSHLLRQVSDQTVGIPTRGVILLSDGQETTGGGVSVRETGAVGYKSGSGVGIGSARLLVAGVGDPIGSADRLIKDLRYPDTAYAGDEIVVELAVTHRFLEADTPPPVIVTLSEGDRTIVEETFTLDRETTHLEIPFPAPEEGLRVFDLQVSGIDNERFLANNKVSLAINVRQGRSRVLVLTDQPGWDLRFLAQAGLAEPRIDLSVVYPSANGLVFADSLVSWVGPDTPNGWNQWDGVVLMGWQGRLGSLDWSSLEVAVKGGLGLLVLPRAVTPGQRAMPAPPGGLADLLPVTATNLRWVDGALFAAIPSGATGHPILHLVSDQGSTIGISTGIGQGLGALPPLRRILGVVPRADALLLLESRQRDRGTGGAHLPLLVVNSVEQGRVAWFGGQRLWEIAFWEPGQVGGAATQGELKIARRLLQNLLVWLAVGQEESGLVFSGRRAFYQEGERITLGAQWRDMRGQPILDRDLSLILRPSDVDGEPAAERTFALRGSPGKAELAEADLPPLPPGNYSIQLVGEGDPPVLGSEEFLVVTSHSIEETQVRQDQRRLGQLAAQAGGSYLSVVEGGALAAVLEEIARLDWSKSFKERRSRFDFWSGWPFLVLVVMLLGIEWFLRRRNGLL